MFRGRPENKQKNKLVYQIPMAFLSLLKVSTFRILNNEIKYPERGIRTVEMPGWGMA
jgi:hypothetical protein